MEGMRVKVKAKGGNNRGQSLPDFAFSKGYKGKGGWKQDRDLDSSKLGLFLKGFWPFDNKSGKIMVENKVSPTQMGEGEERRNWIRDKVGEAEKSEKGSEEKGFVDRTQGEGRTGEDDGGKGLEVKNTFNSPNGGNIKCNTA